MKKRNKELFLNDIGWIEKNIYKEENLITALEIASAVTPNGKARVPEVCIYFDFQLFRGNRAFKKHIETSGKYTADVYATHAQLPDTLTVENCRIVD